MHLNAAFCFKRNTFQKQLKLRRSSLKMAFELPSLPVIVAGGLGGPAVMFTVPGPKGIVFRSDLMLYNSIVILYILI